MTKRIITPFASSGDKNTIPDDAPVTDDGFANYPDGFPPSNSVDPALGGSYVKRADVNGVLNDVTSILKDQAEGLYYTYDATYATEIGGYPLYATLAKVGAVGFWISTSAGNTSNPDAGGANWIDFNPYALVPVGTIFPYSGSSTVAPTGYIFDGAVLSRTTYAALFKLWVTDQGFTAQTFTVTIAAPGVFTKTSHGFTNGERLRLSTTGALPTGLNTTTDYFVEVINANTFYLTASIFGVATRITTTGTQSGTHSYTQSLYGLGDGSTTFNAPDLRGLFLRGLDRSRGIDTSRAMGTNQKGTLNFADTYNTGVGTDAALGSIAVIGNPSVAAALNAGGLDAYTGADYNSNCVVNWSLSANSQALTLGTGGTTFVAGATRPSNIALPFIIKY